MLPSAAQAYQQVQDFEKTRKKSADLIKEAEDKYKLPEVQQRVDRLRGLTSNLESSIEQVDPQVTGRTSGSLVTEAQRAALVNRERTPLMGEYSKLSRDLGGAQDSFSNAQSLANQYAGGLERENDSTYNRLFQSYTAAQAAEAAAEAKRQWEAQQAEQRRQFDAQMAESRRAAAAAQASAYNLGGGGSSGAAAASVDPAIARVATQVNTLKQLQGMDLATAISGLRAKARSGDGTAKLIAQKYYQAIGKPIPFAEFK